MLAKQRNEAIRHVIAYVFTIVMVFLAVTPFIYVVLTALKTKEQIYDPSQIIPTHITFDNFRHVLFQSNFVRYFMNSIFITLVTTLICMYRFRICFSADIHTGNLSTAFFCTFQYSLYTGHQSCQPHIPLAPCRLCILCTKHIFINRYI